MRQWPDLFEALIRETNWNTISIGFESGSDKVLGAMKKGKELFNTRNRGKPVAFVVGTENVMPAWNDGVIGMQAGGKRLLMVPPKLGYGSKGVQDVVPPDANLIFLFELVDLQKAGD